MNTINYSLGCKLPINDWVQLNRVEIFQDDKLREFVSPFPPVELMQNVSGLTSEADFASHGADFYLALSAASPKPLLEYRSILDFGCGCGRLARMFKGHPHRIAGCDIDQRHIKWIQQSLDYMDARVTSVRPPLPYSDDEFDAVISISIFTHLNENSQDGFLSELRRITQKGGYLFLTVHGERALSRAISEPQIRSMLDVRDDLFEDAQRKFAQGRHAFILQQGHLTTTEGEKNKAVSEPFEYGITFIPESYIKKHWSKYFNILSIHYGGIHDFQDIVVLTPAKQ